VKRGGVGEEGGSEKGGTRPVKVTRRGGIRAQREHRTGRKGFDGTRVSG